MTPSDPAIRRFGAYEILHELKHGGMGAVLLGRRRGPGAFEQLVAIKTIRPEYAGAEAVRAMFLDEAAILARIAHPAIATVHDFGEDNGTLYMVMEYVAGTSFRALVDMQLPPGVAARALAEACRGLHAAHEVRDTRGQMMGVVHRDISPDNLMLGFDGHVKVIDFGIALVKNRQAPVTEFGTLKGKPPYMSPEQVKNEAMDRRSDVFSLGVVLHELLTGQPLFDGDSIYAIARAVEHQEIRPPSVVRGAPLPAGLDAAVMAALDRDPARRTPTAAQLAEALEAVISAAGDETLEAWTERNFAMPRDAHRQWLANVVAGRDAPRPAIGRPTGAVTALPLAIAAAPVADHAPDAAAPATVDDDDLVPPRRRVWPLALAGLLLAGGVVIVAMRSQSEPASPPVDASLTIDADASVAHDAAPPDASRIADAVEVVADAAPLRDAGVRRAVDAATARTVPPDAPAQPALRTPPDAAATIAPTGSGFVNFRHRSGGSYVNVTLDGKELGPTPILKRKLAAGPHTVTMRDPVTGDVVYQTTFELTDGETENVTQSP